MTNKQAAQILRDYVEWSQNGFWVPMPFKAKALVKAIDTAVTALEQTEPDELERFKAAVLLLFQWEPDAKFITIDKDGSIAQWEWRPYPMADNTWGSDAGWFPIKWAIKCCSIPDGIDWRDCIIERQ